MTDFTNLQNRLDRVFKYLFGNSSLEDRLNDIYSKALEMKDFKSLELLKKDLGDILSSCIMLANEGEWDINDLIINTINRLETRQNVYMGNTRKVDKKSIALFGGAFDPITFGHINTAQWVLDNIKSIDEVWFMPCYKHIWGKDMEEFTHRYNMIELAIKEIDDPRLKVFDWELTIQNTGSTYDCISQLFASKWSINNQFSLIIGMDNAQTLHYWQNYPKLIEKIRMIVTPRAGVKRDNSIDWYMKSPHILVSSTEYPRKANISSTQVRELLKQDVKLGDLVPVKVLEYIIEYTLYDCSIG